jgi:UDP-N-acetyl-D-mannosaminuronic acid dehydrogenase
VVEKGTLHVTDDISAYEKADAILIAVQTPVDENHQPRYESLRQVCADVGDRMKKGAIICIESTVAPGTTNNLVKPILEEHSGMQAGDDFNLVFSYERVMVGRLLHNLQNYVRIVGGYTPECTKRGVELFKHIMKAELMPTDSLTAEVAKVTENTYRDVNVAFANEVALICESLGTDVHEVRRFVNSLPNDPSNPAANPYRNMHTPGAGVGGHCLPKDPWLLKYGLDAFGTTKFTPNILVESRRLNDGMPRHMKELIAEALDEKGKKLRESKIAILGFAFLENSDDSRNTPALPIYNLLKESCGEVIVHDPHIREYEGVSLTSDLDEALRGRDCLVLVTRHNQYLDLPLDRVGRLLRTPVIVDGRNVFNRDECGKAGFAFRGVGIPK